MVNSACWLAQDALKAAVSAITYPAPAVSVSLGTPVNFNVDHIVVSGSVSNWNADYPFTATTARDESFTLSVIVYVTRSTNDYATVRNRAVVLGDLVLGALRSDPSLGGTVMRAEADEFEMEEASGDEHSRGVALTINVRCRAHVS